MTDAEQKGYKKGIRKLFKLAMCIKTNINASQKPYKPNIADKINTIYFVKRNPETSDIFGMTNVQIPVNAEIITTLGLTIPASTAACPIIIPPTIPIVELTGEGSRIPPSHSNSNANSIINISPTAGNGIFCRVCAIFNAKFVGSMEG